MKQRGGSNLRTSRVGRGDDGWRHDGVPGHAEPATRSAGSSSVSSTRYVRLCGSADGEISRTRASKCCSGSAGKVTRSGLPDRERGDVAAVASSTTSASPTVRPRRRPAPRQQPGRCRRLAGDDPVVICDQRVVLERVRATTRLSAACSRPTRRAVGVSASARAARPRSDSCALRAITIELLLGKHHAMLGGVSAARAAAACSCRQSIERATTSPWCAWRRVRTFRSMSCRPPERPGGIDYRAYPPPDSAGHRPAGRRRDARVAPTPAVAWPPRFSFHDGRRPRSPPTGSSPRRRRAARGAFGNSSDQCLRGVFPSRLIHVCILINCCIRIQ